MESKSQFDQSKEPSLNEIYQQQIEEIFEKISALNEQTVSFENHSKKWNELFVEFVALTQKIAENLWKHTAVYIVTGNEKGPDSKYALTSDVFEPMEYIKVSRWILNGYDSKKAKSTEHTFWNYYITSLRNEVYRNYSRERAKFYYSKGQGISQKIQRGINLIIRIKKENNMYPNSEEEFLKKYNKEEYKKIDNENNAKVKEIFVQQIQQKIDEYAARGKQFWMPKECKTAEAYYDYLVKVNEKLISNVQVDVYGESYDENSQGYGLDRYEDEKNYAPGEVSADFDTLREYLETVQANFTRFINRKKQKEEAQRKKVLFYRELVTLYFMQVISKTHPEFSEKDYYELFKDLNFASPKIIKEFLESTELNYNKLSLNWKRPKNYASKQLKIIKNYFNI